MIQKEKDEIVGIKIKILIFSIIIGLILFVGIYIFLNQTLAKRKFLFSEVQAVVYKTPTCGCCQEYIGYLKTNGFKVEVKEVDDKEAEKIKKQIQIPFDLWSCHTTFINDYFIEGHVPVEAISKLLTKKPDIDGIALPDMPSGSPGMPGIKFYPFKIHSIKDGKDLGLFMEI